MRKISIKSLGPIQDVEMDLKPMTIVLGEQASGKSTVAQCIHLFLSLENDYIRDLALIDRFSDLRSVKIKVEDIVRSKFYAYYGSAKYLDHYDVKFFFNVAEDKYIHIHPVNGKTTVEFSSSFDLIGFERELEPIFEQPLTTERNIYRFRDAVRNFLSGKTGESLDSLPKYFPAGRNLSSAFSDVFISFFTQNFRYPTRLGKNVPKSAQMELMSEFILYSSELKDRLLQHNGNFNALFSDSNVDKAFKDHFEMRVIDILKGKYIVSRGNELIKVSNGVHIPLQHASSGQQESLRILQDMALLCADRDRTYRTIEEPEAHLFPTAQKSLTELLVMCLNRTQTNFFLTTHSPYFLSTFNNLLYASKSVEGQVNGVTKKVERLGYPDYLRLPPNHFAAYQMGNGRAISIYDPEDALIQISDFDQISDKINSDFEQLAEIVREKEYHE